MMQLDFDFRVNKQDVAVIGFGFINTIFTKKK